MLRKNLSECTTILVGKKQSDNGAHYVCRSEDWDAMNAKNLEIFEDTDNGPTSFKAQDSPFTCNDLPQKAYGYKTLAPYHLQGHWGSAGFNTKGVGMSATESIFSSDKVLEFDPLVPNGIAENSVYNIVIPYIDSARDGVIRLGNLIEKYGIAEGFGVGFIDNKEIWYLETGSGHRWLATRIPHDLYFITGNQSRFRKYNPNDKENYLASEDLIEFAYKNGLIKTEDPKDFDFHTAYIRDIELDTTYNYPRVWGLQKEFTPSVKQDVSVNNFPVFTKADNPISLDELRKAFRFHYDNTDHDPYLNENPNEVYRPVSIFRTCQTHILQIREDLPIEIGCVNFVAFGMADLGVFVPIYGGLKSYPPPYVKGNNKSSEDSAYWIFRKVQTLGMVNYNKYAPIIKERYLALEKEMDQRMEEFEREYLHFYKENPYRSDDLLQSFNHRLMNLALEVSKELIEELFTLLTKDIQEEYLFHGA